MGSAVKTIAVVLSIVTGTLIASGVPAHSATCGDANRTGSVTVTDGVLVLRAAAQLPSVCAKERCDMNLDGNISVTDGVLALRVAAGIQTQVACSSTQADAIFGQILKTMNLGGNAAPASRAITAGTTTPCTDGGSKEDDGVTITFFDCHEGDFLTNGTLTIADTGPDTLSLFYDTTDVILSSGETVATFGSLDFLFGSDNATVNGALTHQSSIFGEYTDQYTDVTLDPDFVVLSGTVTTSISEGQGLFANLALLDTVIFSATLAQINVTYTDGDFDVFTLADGLCEPCSSGCSNDSLTCLSCVDGCSNDTARCGIDFDFLDCDDGLFGPTGLCVPCTSDDECDASEGLSCFSCGKNCTGNIQRCGSSKAFVECEDGTF
jgi:hypothetical protein